MMLAGCSSFPTDARPIASRSVRGITLVDWSAHGYLTPSADSALNAIAATGATDIALLVTLYQPTTQSSEVHADSLRTPSDTAVGRLLRLAVALGLKPTVKLHVDPEDGNWRARIDPQDATRWFQSYGNFLVHFADLVESNGGNRFSIGCELASTLGHADKWRELIRSVREHFTGRLSYAASWDEAGLVPFWGDLDEVGVDCYYPVTVRDRAGSLEALAGWAPVIERLQRLHLQTGKAILLTEIGYRSVDGAGRHPYEYGSEGRVDLQEQADLYWAALHATSGADWIAGLYWWNWAADGSGGSSNTDYTPSGKPAEQLLKSAWRE